MKAVLLLKQKLTDADGDIWELVVWKVPESVYIFVDVSRLIEDFQHEIAHWKKGRGD